MCDISGQITLYKTYSAVCLSAYYALATTRHTTMSQQSNKTKKDILHFEAKPCPDAHAFPKYEVKVDRRKISALSRITFDIPISEYSNRSQNLRDMIASLSDSSDKENHTAFLQHKSGLSCIPLLSPQAQELRFELLKASLAEAEEIQKAHAFVQTAAYKDMCTSMKLDSIIAFPPEIHAKSMRNGYKVHYRLYQNGFLNILNANRNYLSEAKAVNRLVLTCITTAASVLGLQKRIRDVIQTRSEINMDRVPCEEFGQCVINQISYALDNFLDALPSIEPALMHRKQDLCYLQFMAHSLFDKDSQEEVYSLFNTKHASLDENVASIRAFLSKKCKVLGLRPISAAMSAPDCTRTLYAGLIGSIVANSLIAAYALRCNTAAPSKVTSYTKCLQDDYDRTKLKLSAASLPLCIKTLGPGSSTDKRLLIINSFDNVSSAGLLDMDGEERVEFLSKLGPRTMHVVNNVISAIHGGHNKKDGVSDCPIYDGSEYSFNHFNDMSTYAVRQVVEDITDALHKREKE